MTTAVAITPRSFRQASREQLEILRQRGIEARLPGHDRPLIEREMVELVRGCSGLIVGVDPVTASVLEAGPLRVVVKYGTGMDNIDLAAARRLGVKLGCTPRSNARSVAELTMALLLALARHVALHDRLVRAESWSRRMGIELLGRRLGVVGYGAIAREVTKLARAFGMEVVAHDPLLMEADVELVSLEEVLSSCDAVSLHLPLDETTRGLIGREELGRMRPDALLINTSRGAIVDEDALAEALTAGSIGGAALDAFSEEPPSRSRLLGLDNIVLSPHAGAATVDAARRTSREAISLLLREL